MRKLVLLPIGLATLLPVWTTLAAISQIPGGFTQINMQDGGYLAGIVQHQSGRLFARPDGGGMYRSDNQGNSWTWLGSNMTTPGALVTQGIAVQHSATSSSNLILIACGASSTSTDPGRGVWKTTDGGATWTLTLSGVNFSGGDAERVGGECIMFNPTNDNEVWAGSRGTGVWVSEDAGNTWTKNSSLGTNICSSLYIHPMASNTIFYGGDGGLWVTTNHGTNWGQLVSSPLVYRITSSGVDGTVYFVGGSGQPQLVEKITATSWTNTNTYAISSLLTAYQSGIGNDGLSLITVTVLKDGRLLVSDGEGYLRVSSNEGTTFSTLNMANYAPGLPIPQWASPTVFQWKPTSLIQDVHNTNFWYGGAGYGPLATTNSGTNWQYIVNGLAEVDVWRVSFHPTDPDRFYISCDDLGGAIVTDSGLSGNTASMLYDAFNSLSCCQFARIGLACYTNEGSSTYYNRVIFPGGSEQNNTCLLYESINDGATWFSPSMHGLPTNVNGTPLVAAIDSVDNPDDFLVIASGVVSNGGGGIYRTINAGTNFTQSSWGTNPNDLTAGTLNLGNYNYCTVWMDRDATNVNVRYLYSMSEYPNPANPVTNSGGGFYISYDRGVTWAQPPVLNGGIVINGDYNDFVGQMVSDHAVSGNVWIAFRTSAGNTFHNGLALSTNYGTNFQAVGGFTNTGAIGANQGTVGAYNHNVAVLGQMAGDAFPKIYYSTNDGATWGVVTGTNAEFPETSSLDLDPHWPGRLFISTTGRSVGIFVPTASRQTPIINDWPTATAITYGQTLANSILTGGSASLGGSFAFTTPSTVPGAGTAPQSVTFTPTNSVFYSNVVGAVSVSVTVNPLPVILMGTEAYDGSTNAPASVLSVSNVVGIDNVTVASGYATLAGSAVGVQPITGFSTLFLGGAQVANYTLTGASGAVTVTNSFNPVSITSAALDVTGTNLVFSWQSVPGVVYTVLTNNALTPIQSWSVAGTLVTATNTNASVTLPGVVLTGSNLFVAIKQQ